MSLLEHAKTEMKAAGLYDKDADYGGMIPQAVEEIVGTFAKQGHSGMSASIVTSILEKVLRYKPLVPLTGKPEEWTDVAEHNDGRPMYQNKRCGGVFAYGPNGEDAYFIDGKVFRTETGGAWTNGKSKVPVTFPYTPTTEYVTITEEQREKGDY
jgi:hypothetical protein